MHDLRAACSCLSLACKTSKVFQVVNFILLLTGRIVSLLRETILSNNITIDNKDGGVIINVTIVLGKNKGTLRSRIGSRLQHKCLKFPKQWESLDLALTKGNVRSGMR